MEIFDIVQSYGREIVSVGIGVAAATGHYLLEKKDPAFRTLANSIPANATAIALLNMVVNGFDPDDIQRNLINGAITATAYVLAYGSTKIPEYTASAREAQAEADKKRLEDMFD